MKLHNVLVKTLFKFFMNKAVRKQIIKMNKLRILYQIQRFVRFQPIRTMTAGLSRKSEAKFIKCNTVLPISHRNWSATGQQQQGEGISHDSPLDSVTYERVCAETLDALCDYFEELLENASNLNGSDVAYSDGVLTVKLGKKYGTYVINRQTPNRQIWLSSPTSGPKRFDFVGPKTGANGRWIYKHTNESMHELLQRELKLILKDENLKFFDLPYSSSS